MAAEKDLTGKKSILERKGSEPISQEEKQTTFWRLFLTWGGFAIVSSSFMVGSYCSQAGFIAGLIGIFVGVSFKVIMLGIGAYIGSREGLPGTMAMRIPFGVNGRFISAIPMLLASVGWFAVQVGITSSAVNEICKQLVQGWDIPIQYLYVILAIVMGIIAVYGYKVMIWFQSFVVPIMLVILVWIVYKMVTTLDFSLISSFRPEHPISLPEAINIIPAAGPALMIAAADLSRYAKSPFTATSACVASNGLLYTTTATLGFIGAIFAGTWDPAKVMVNLGMGIIALVMLILASWSANCLNAYWGGMALTTSTTGLKKYPRGLPRPMATFVVAVLGLVLVLSGIYTSGGFRNFLIFLGATLAPANGILTCEFFVIRREMRKRVNTANLDIKGGEIWYTKGWHIPAVAAWLISASLASMLNDVTKYIPAVTSFFLAGILYYIFYRIYYAYFDTSKKAS